MQRVDVVFFLSESAKTSRKRQQDRDQSVHSMLEIRFVSVLISVAQANPDFVPGSHCCWTLASVQPQQQHMEISTCGLLA